MDTTRAPRARPLNDGSGQALVEFALVLPILLLVAFLLLFVGEVGLHRLALEHGAAEGARNGSYTNDDEQIRRAIAAAVRPLDPGQVRVTIEPDRQSRTRGSLLTVRVSYREPMPLGFVRLSSTVASLVRRCLM